MSNAKKAKAYPRSSTIQIDSMGEVEYDPREMLRIWHKHTEALTAGDMTATRAFLEIILLSWTLDKESLADCDDDLVARIFQKIGSDFERFARDAKTAL